MIIRKREIMSDTNTIYVGDLVELEFDDKVVIATFTHYPQNEAEMWEFKEEYDGRVFSVNVHHRAFVGVRVLESRHKRIERLEE